MGALASGFKNIEYYSGSSQYSLLPFRFTKLDEQRYVATNLAGEHIILPAEEIGALIEKRISAESPFIEELESKHFISRGNLDAHLELLAAQIRTRQSRLPDLAALHMFVVTLRCNQSCGYCQVSRVSEDRHAFDMSEETADRAIDLMLQSPSEHLKVEFQGGESLLNFPLIKYSKSHKKLGI
jgi:sulfatase maturation enzyme AslB (radical SAM superfamily)